MALTLLSLPTSPALAYNPAIVQFRADQDGGGTLYDAVGVTALLEYVETDRFATNETLTVEYEEPDGTTTTVEFTAKAVHDDADEIPDASWAGSDSAYWLEIKNKVAQHPLIAPFFEVILISSGGDKIRIRERTAAAGWTLTVTNSEGFTVTDAAAVADATPANYRVLLEVYFENTYRAGNYALAARLDGLPEVGTGYVYYDLSSILAAECRAARATPLVPTFGTDAPFLADNFRRYYMRYTEEFGIPAAAENWTPLNPQIALDGGVSQATFAEGNFLGDLDDDNALLTWMPDGKKVAIEQPEYLAWYNHAGATRTVFLRVVAYDINDGSDATPADYFTPGLSVRAGEVAVFPVWPALFGFDVDEDVYKYTVQVGYTVIGFDALSQARTYYIDRDYYETPRNLMYLNSFGVPETWRCTGQWGKRLRVEREVAEKPLLPGFATVATDIFQHARDFDTELTYRTGFLTAAEAEALQEMLIAGEVYDVSATGYIPLRITSDAFRVTETRQELHSYEFTALPRLKMKNYSRKTLATIGSDAWLDENGAPWWDELEVAWENE